MAKDWAAVAAAITTRLAELDMTQKELADRSGVAAFTLRQIQNPDAYPARRRSTRTLGSISRALRLPEDYLARIADHGAPATDQPDLETEVADLRREVVALRERVDQLEAREDDTR